LIYNEKGMVLPFMLAIALILSSLVLTISNRLETQMLSYEQRVNFQKINLLEKETIQIILSQIEDPDFSPVGFESSDTITLKNGTIVTLNYRNGSATLEIKYNFSYNDYQSNGTINYNKRQQTYTLE